MEIEWTQCIAHPSKRFRNAQAKIGMVSVLRSRCVKYLRRVRCMGKRCVGATSREYGDGLRLRWILVCLSFLLLTRCQGAIDYRYGYDTQQYRRTVRSEGARVSASTNYTQVRNSYLPAGVILERVGAYEKAIQLYRRAVSADPFDYLTFFNMGNAYRKSGRFGRALESYHQALRIRMGYFPAINNCLDLMIRLGCCRRIRVIFINIRRLRRLIPRYLKQTLQEAGTICGVQQKPPSVREPEVCAVGWSQ